MHKCKIARQGTALFLKLSEMFSDALFFRRFLGWLLFLFELQIVFPHFTLISFHNTLYFTVGCPINA